MFNWSKTAENVIYTGQTDVVEQYLSAMDCYVLPSYREGFGIGVVEAEAMGVPVIVTNIPGPIDAMADGETGTIVEKKDVRSLLNAMVRLKDDAGLACQYGQKAVKLARDNFEQGEFLKRVLEDRKALIQGDVR